MAARMTIAKKRQMVIQHMKLLENRRRRSDEADKLKVVNSQQIALTEELERIKELPEYEVRPDPPLRNNSPGVTWGQVNLAFETLRSEKGLPEMKATIAEKRQLLLNEAKAKLKTLEKSRDRSDSSVVYGTRYSGIHDPEHYMALLNKPDTSMKDYHDVNKALHSSFATQEWVNEFLEQGAFKAIVKEAIRNFSDADAEDAVYIASLSEVDRIKLHSVVVECVYSLVDKSAESLELLLQYGGHVSDDNPLGEVGRPCAMGLYHGFVLGSRASRGPTFLCEH